MDVVMLSRIQLGLTTAFHIVFPTLTIGFALFISTVFIWTPYHNPVFYPLGETLILPVVLGYIFHSYRVFHGKIVYWKSYE
jgi:cytochrome bd-type quinol oxidase subunit 1